MKKTLIPIGWKSIRILLATCDNDYCQSNRLLPMLKRFTTNVETCHWVFKSPWIRYIDPHMIERCMNGP